MPLPWLAIEVGWLVAEFGRQPWVVDGVLPTFLGASSLTHRPIWATIAGFTAIYGDARGDRGPPDDRGDPQGAGRRGGRSCAGFAPGCLPAFAAVPAE